MFEHNTRAQASHRYEINWLVAPEQQFTALMNSWMQRLSMNRIRGGTSTDNRKALTTEFLAMLYIYELMLKTQRTELRSKNVPNTDLSMMELNFAISTAESRIEIFQQAHRGLFGGKNASLDPSEYAVLHAGVDRLLESVKGPVLKRRIIANKLRLVNFWIHGVDNFNDHIDDVSLFIQYLYNAPSSKVRCVLDVMLRDSAKLMNMPDPTRSFKVETEKGLTTEGKAEWSYEDFKVTVKAEAEASYGVSLKAEGEWEITGLKAKMSAEAFAGARAKFEGEASFSPEGIEAKAEVEVMVGVSLKFDASLEVGDIFMLEVGAEAFAGALAKAEAEFSLTKDGIKIKVEAEAFLGAKLEGKASFGVKIAGYEIVKGTAKGALTAGLGATMSFEFEASTMGGVKFGFDCGLTAGVGMEGGAEIEFHGDNLYRAVDAIYYKAFYHFALSALENKAYWEYFRGLEDNKELLEKAKEELEKFKVRADAEYNSATNANVKLGIIKRLADDQWVPRTHAVLQLAERSNKTREQRHRPHTTRARRGAVSGRPIPRRIA